MKRAAHFAVMLAALLVSVVSVAGGIRLWTSSDSLPGISRDTQVIIGSIEAGPTEIQLPATLPISAIAGRVVNAPAWAGGTVTWVTTEKTVANGRDVVEVNGERAVLCAGSTPFYRPLSVRASGGDVDAIRRCLGLNGSGPATRQTLTALAKRLDLLDPRTGRLPAGTTEVPTSRLIWVPEAPVHIAKMHLTVGSPAPAAGAALATLASGSRLGQVTLGGLSSADTRTVLSAATRRVFATGAVEATVAEDRSVSASGVDWSRLAADATAGAGSGGSAPAQGQDAPNPADAATDGTINGTVTLTFAKTAVVPSSALYAGADGQVCLAEREGERWVGRVVTPVPFGWGQSIVDPSLIGRDVALNPQALGAARPACTA